MIQLFFIFLRIIFLYFLFIYFWLERSIIKQLFKFQWVRNLNLNLVKRSEIVKNIILELTDLENMFFRRLTWIRITRERLYIMFWYIILFMVNYTIIHYIIFNLF
jgi:hypothetical protein